MKEQLQNHHLKLDVPRFNQDLILGLFTLMLLFNAFESSGQSFPTVQVNPFSISNSPSDYPSPTFGDLDNDGDMDLLTGNQSGAYYYYENVGDRYFATMTTAVLNPFGLSTIPNGFTTPNLVDLDADGDLDVITSNAQGRFYYHENIGSSSSPSFAGALLNPFGLSFANYFTKLSVADMDNDGDQDLLAIAQSNTEINFYYYQNTGSNTNASFAAPATNAFSLTSPTFAIPFLTIADFDTDGDPDVMVLLASGPFEYFENNGTASSPSFLAPVTNPFSLGNVGITIGTADLDGDGDLDLFTGQRYGSYKYLKNAELPTTVVWDGELNVKWNEPTNWNGNILPSINDKVIIPEIVSTSLFPTIDSDIEVFDLTIETNAILTVSEASIKVERYLEMDGSLFVSSGASLLPMSHVFGSGSFTINRNTTFNTAQGQYSIVGSPITTGTVADLGPLVYAYDENTAYGDEGEGRFSLASALTLMTPGDAYFSSNTGTLGFVGMPNSGVITQPLVYNQLLDGGAGNAGFNLVSNPYPAAISYRGLTGSNSDIDGTIYLWDDGGSDLGRRTNNDYITVTGAGAVGGSGRVGDWDGNIRSCQGFFVKASSAGTLTFSPNMMSISNNDDVGYFRKEANSAPAGTIKLELSNEYSKSEILIAMREDATMGFDRTLDGQKMLGTAPIQLYSLMEDEPLAIQAIPVPHNSTNIKLGMSLERAGTYGLKLNEQNFDEIYVSLIDQYSGQVIELNEKDDYTFTALAGNDRNRFGLMLSTSKTLSTDTDLKETIDVFMQGHQLIIKGPFNEEATLSIFNLNGQSIIPETKMQLDENGAWQMLFSRSGLFVLHIQTKETLFITKFIH